MRNQMSVNIIGRLAVDPKVRPAKDENSRPSGSLILGLDGMKQKDEKYPPNVGWCTVRISGQTLEYASNYLKKGAPVNVIGRVMGFSIVDSKSGDKTISMEVYAWAVNSLESNRGDNNNETQYDNQGGNNSSAPF
jgi:single-stranded DNA-binding protein